MTQQKSNTLKVMYKDQLENISYPENSKYEDIIEIVSERFDIPFDQTDFIQISNENSNVFEKDTFENYILLFPNPEIIFHINVCDMPWTFG